MDTTIKPHHIPGLLEQKTTHPRAHVADGETPTLPAPVAHGTCGAKERRRTTVLSEWEQC